MKVRSIVSKQTVSCPETYNRQFFSSALFNITRESKKAGSVVGGGVCLFVFILPCCYVIISI